MISKQIGNISVLESTKTMDAVNNTISELGPLPNHALFLYDNLKKGNLHKVFLICPDAHRFIQFKEEANTFCFHEDFIDYLNKVIKTQTIYFDDDNPRIYHSFSKPGDIMLTLLMPPNRIVCINGKLGLKNDKLILKHIVGAYLFHDSEQFHYHSEFDPHAIQESIH